jgi:Holliday junction resolvase
MQRDKGARGEREVVDVFRAYFPDLAVQRAAGGTEQQSGDLVRVPGAFVSVKRQEILRLPLWIREAEAEADGLGLVPVIAYRTNQGGPAPDWRGDLPLRDLGRIMADAELYRLTGGV